MMIWIVGAGHIGGTLARAWARAGHDLVFEVRSPHKIHGLLEELGDCAHLASSADLAEAEVTVFAGPYSAWPEYGRRNAAALAGKPVIDAANPYPDRDGAMADEALQAGSGLATAGFVPGAHVVKAFNTLYWEHLAKRAGDGLGMAIAGNDIGALELAERLVRDAGFEPVRAGSLSEAWRLDPGQPAYGKPLEPEALRAALAEAKHP